MARRTRKLDTENTTDETPKATIESFPKADLDKSIMVSKGVAFISIGGNLFQYNVPTYVPPLIRKELDDSFEVYDPTYKLYKNSDNPIFVSMPMDIRYLVSGITALHRIRKLFPTCKIEVQIRDEYKSMLPGFAKAISFRNGRERYYRSFDLRESAMSTYWLTALTERIEPIHELMIKGLGLYDVEKDKGMPIQYYSKPIPEREGYAIIHDNSEFAKRTLQKFNSPNLKAFEDGSQPAVSNLKGVVYIGDSREIFRSLYYKTPTMAIIPDNKFKHQIQYKVFEGVKIAQHPDSVKLGVDEKPEYEDLLKEIGKFIGVKSPSRKRSYGGMEDDVTATNFSRSHSEDTAE